MVYVELVPTYAQQLIFLGDSTFKINDGQLIEISSLKFYISNIELYYDNKLVFIDKERAHLIDAARLNHFYLELPDKLQFNKIAFHVGIDSVSNVSGAMGGDLDPTRGMYWTWQSGYINAKIEGKHSSSSYKHNEFELHLGGYAHPNNCLQKVVLPIGFNETITIQLTLDQFLKQINFKETNHIVSPSLKAVELSKLFANSFSIIQQ
jgi:hypothetical protein